jgi:hypothetical protein
MNNKTLTLIFEICIIPLLGTLTAFVCAYIRSKTKQLQAKSDNEKADQYLGYLQNTIITCLRATNQTYVEALKEQNAFDAEAHKIALDKTKSAVLATLTDDAKKYLPLIIGDLELYIVEQIEANIANNK